VGSFVTPLGVTSSCSFSTQVNCLNTIPLPVITVSRDVNTHVPLLQQVSAWQLQLLVSFIKPCRAHKIFLFFFFSFFLFFFFSFFLVFFFYYAVVHSYFVCAAKFRCSLPLLTAPSSLSHTKCSPCLPCCPTCNTSNIPPQWY
jgi:hypothetical protein